MGTRPRPLLVSVPLQTLLTYLSIGVRVWLGGAVQLVMRAPSEGRVAVSEPRSGDGGGTIEREQLARPSGVLTNDERGRAVRAPASGWHDVNLLG
jgi:hypothetical protein